MDFSYQVNCVNLSDLISNDEYEEICKLIANEYTWGDTDLSLVKKDRFIYYLISERHNRNPELVSKIINMLHQAFAEYVNLL